MSQRYFKLNQPDVSAEDFKSEILAVNLKNGYYHSLREAAVPIWRLLVEGRTPETIVQWLAPVYGCPVETLAADVDLFIAELEKVQLIVAQAAPAGSPASTLPEWLAELPPVYSKPVLETYSDMQDLLLLDPIHDVDATGWPNAAKPQSNEP